MRKIAIAIGLIAIAYLVVVVASGAGWNPFEVPWNFTNSGQFGDSFGPFSAIMSSIAAISAFLAYTAQRDELHRLKKSSEQDRASNDRRDFEGTFFKLLDMLRNTVRDTEYDRREKVRRGVDAFQAIIERIQLSVDGEAINPAEKYKKEYFRHRQMLGHYFRLCYHIVKYVDESKMHDKMQYFRIFRSTLSNPELVLLGLNCAFGQGVGKFKPLVEKYALLHNISASDAEKFDLIDCFATSAFGDRAIRDGKLSE